MMILWFHNCRSINGKWWMEKKVRGLCGCGLTDIWEQWFWLSFGSLSQAEEGDMMRSSSSVSWFWSSGYAYSSVLLHCHWGESLWGAALMVKVLWSPGVSVVSIVCSEWVPSLIKIRKWALLKIVLCTSETQGHTSEFINYHKTCTTP